MKFIFICVIIIVLMVYVAQHNKYNPCGGIIMENNLVAGALQTKNNIYYIVIYYKGNKGEHKQKWYCTGLNTKNNKKKAEDLLLQARTLFNPNDIKKKLNDLLNSNDSNTNETHINNTLGINANPNEKVHIDGKFTSNVPTEQENDILFTDYMLSWLKKSKRRLEATTYAGYQNNINKKVIPYFKEKNLLLNEIRAKDIHGFYEALIEQGYKTETVKRCHANIRKALVDAANSPEELLKTNIIDRLRIPEKPSVEIYRAKYYLLEELNELFSVAKDSKIKVPIYLAGFYGFRREEIIGLKWSAIDFVNDTITVDFTVSECYIDGVFTLVEKRRAKNKKSLRSLPLLPEIKEVLLEHKQNIEFNKKEYKKEYCRKYSEYICVHEMGDLIRPNYTSKVFKKLLEDNNLRHIRFHDLRHTCASLLLSKGVPMKDIQEWLGHSCFAVTADLYGHLDYSSKVKTGNVISNSGLLIN